MTDFLLQHDLLTSATRQPDQQAVTDGITSRLYAELNLRSNRLAHCLKALGVSRHDRVLVCQQRGIDFLTAILGILKAGAAYVPLDGKTPRERLLRIFKDAAPGAVISDCKTLKSVEAALSATGSAAPLIILETWPEQSGDRPANLVDGGSIDNCDAHEPATVNHADDLAYILYTSGSTGQPKGVMVSHANVRAYIDWAVTCFKLEPADRVLGTAPFHFDMSTFDIFAPLRAGATLCLASELQTLFPQKLIDYIEQQQVTIWKGVASLLMYVARTGSLRQGTMPTLRQVLFAGEQLPTRYLIDWMRTFPDKSFYNAYGPTEATGVTTCYRVAAIPDDSLARIPIGKPRRGADVLLLGEDGNSVATGEVGEICITGDGLARGYLNDPEKTARAFQLPRQDRPRLYRTGDLGRLLSDGNLDYLGRKDRQLKFMGYRIEAGEIEQALLALEQIKDAAVMLLDSRTTDGVQELVAFCEADDKLDVAMIETSLKTRLPAYMVPKRFIQLTSMPRCSRGKIAWDQLQSHDRQS